MTHPTDELSGDEMMTRDQAEPSNSRRIVDRIDPRLVRLLTVLGFGLPLVGYLWLLVRYSVNTMYADQWSDVTVIEQSYAHFFPWGTMWIQHFENRVFFPNIIVVLLAHTVHFSVQVEEYLGGVMLIASTAILVVAHKRRSRSLPWLYYCPVALLSLSIVQYQNTLWGFQLAWFIVLLALAVAVLLLDRVGLSWLLLGGAIFAAVIGSFSSLQGLLIWPTGLVLLYYRRRSLPYVGVWISAAAASTILYFHNYDFAVSPNSQFARHHPLATIKFFLFAIGDVVGKPVTLGSTDTDNIYVVLFGLAIVALAVGTVLICGLRRDVKSSSPVGIALICYGLLFAALITQGRSFLGFGGASFSRYTTFDLLILVGIYLALLGRVPGASLDLTPADPAVGQSRSPRPRRAGEGWSDRVALPGALALVFVTMVVQIPLGVHNGVQGAQVLHASDLKAASVLRNIDHVSDGQIAANLYFLEPPLVIRQQADTLKKHHLNVFAGG
jgi:hypothetical protein